MASTVTPVLSVVTRKAPELIAPACQTPREVKHLSDIDDQENLRFQVPVIWVYKSNDPSSYSSKQAGRDPVMVIREAVSKALVFYYPLAGRLREAPSDRKLMVDCNGEGVMFIEADANFTVDHLRNDNDRISPSFPFLDQLLYNVPGSDGILGCPILLIQVTRLICGGFILAVRLNHTMCDGSGLLQFIKCMEEMASGQSSPSLLPVWEREILNARNPPRVTCTHNEFEHDAETSISPNSSEDTDHRSFYFGSKELTAIRNQLPIHLKTCSTFDLISASVWKCRTIALALEPEAITRSCCVVNARGKRLKMGIPSGYYGNAFAYPAACSVAKHLCEKPISYAIELVSKAKAEMSAEYIRSVADLTVIKERRIRFPATGTSVVSDLTKIGFEGVDFGWGKPVYAGTAAAVAFISFFSQSQNKNGESEVVVPLCLPQLVMHRFQAELHRMLQGFVDDLYNNKNTETLSKL